MSVVHSSIWQCYVHFLLAGALWDHLAIWFFPACGGWWYSQQDWWLECRTCRIWWPSSWRVCCWNAYGCNTCSGLIHIDFLPHPSWHLFNCFISLITWYLFLCLIGHQVVVASFIAEGKKSKPAEARKVEPMAAPPPQMATFVPAPVATSPPSEGTSSASSDDSGSPINHSAMPFNHSSQHQHPHQHQHMPPAYASGGWSLSVHQQNRHDSDMKMMSN